MVRKFVSMLLVLCVLPGIALAQEAHSLLSIFVAYTDLRMRSIEQSLEIVASTREAESGNWNEVQGLLKGYQKSEQGIILWYALPSGHYYTVDKGLMAEKLNKRSYFPDLMAGRNIVGSLVISKSTGRRSAVIGVPLKKNGKVIAAVGASIFLDVLSSRISSILALDETTSFFALAPNGLTALHSKTDRNFLDPRELGSETLKQAAEVMLSKESGEVSYEFDKTTKHAVFATSPLTHWKFAITRSR